MSVKSRVTIKAELAALLIDTAPQGSITPSVLLAKFNDICDSYLNSPTDTNLQGLYPYDATLIYYNGAIVQYDYKWYKANTTTVAGAFDTAKWDFQSYVKYSGSLAIPTAQVLTLNSVPKTLVAAIAARTIVLVSAPRLRLTYNSIAYATNTSLDIYMAVGGAPNVAYTVPTFLANVADTHKIATVTANAALATNAALMVRVNSGDPTAGNSAITVYFEYIVAD